MNDDTRNNNAIERITCVVSGKGERLRRLGCVKFVGSGERVRE